jgi:hypothetical protein
MRTALAKLVMMCLKYTRTRADFVRILGRWMDVAREVARAPHGLEALAQVMCYVLEVNEYVEPEELQGLLEREIGPEAKDAIMTAGQRLIEQGRQQVSGMYTAAKTDFAPDGKWDKADPTVPVSRWRFSIEYAKGYFGQGADGDAAAVSTLTKPTLSIGAGVTEELSPGTFVTKDGYLGALSEARLDQVIELLASGGNAAVDRLLATGEVFALKSGLQVTVVDHEGFLASVVKVRKRGMLVEFWTVREALNSP